MPIKNIKKDVTVVSKEVANITMDAADLVEGGVEKTVKGVNTYISPIRETVFKRYPVLFSVLVASGAIFTVLGFEYILHRYSLLVDHPWVIFIIGVVILAFTGKLYKNLNEDINK